MIVYERKLPPRVVLISVSNTQHIGPALIVGAVISGTAEKPDAQVYDGVNANGTMKLNLRVIADTSFSPVLTGGIECLTGIYVAVDAATTFLTLLYYPGREIEQPA